MKYVSIKSTLCVLGIAFFVTNNVSGQSTNQEREATPVATAEKLFAKMDMNEDGRLTKNELNGTLRHDFKKIDSNADGIITEEEFLEAPKLTKKAMRKDDPQ
ncbi:EF-hand domain-containing protein [Aggregatimonas sangjinii]|uniref:EF-hand domain-containing protein n=1 Tax=Aggregatimonas sangjinii TaxID=2583587 RepID=A0A5B7SYA3_9FLAO|nr:EF-hand domain-containing protein [Aggregatimonas sangjinii]QCX01891.1 EF-hand domain-containing protein [Aggregatimonas sangjinii]